MCVTVPGRVVATGPAGAEVLLRGRRVLASTLLVQDVRVGDYVLVSLGAIIERLDEDEARLRLALFDELAQLLERQY